MTVTGNGMVSCELESPAVNAPKETDEKALHATANEVGVLAHLVSETVRKEPLDPNAEECLVASTVCCP